MRVGFFCVKCKRELPARTGKGIQPKFVTFCEVEGIFMQTLHVFISYSLLL